MSKNKIVTYGRISPDGRLYISLRRQFDLAIAAMSDNTDDVPVKMTIEKKYRQRTSLQNRYYFGVIVDILAGLIAEAAGETVNAQHREQAHEILKLKCNAVEIVSPTTGEAIDIPGTTTKHNTTECTDYHERCRQWIFEFFGVVVPLPNEQISAF